MFTKFIIGYTIERQNKTSNTQTKTATKAYAYSSHNLSTTLYSS